MNERIAFFFVFQTEKDDDNEYWKLPVNLAYLHCFSYIYCYSS